MPYHIHITKKNWTYILGAVNRFRLSLPAPSQPDDHVIDCVVKGLAAGACAHLHDDDHHKPHSLTVILSD